MSTKHAVYLASCVAMSVFALALALPVFVAIPTLWYRPVDHEWSVGVHATGIAIDFFGRCAFASAISIAATATTYAIARRVCSRDPRSVTTTFVGVSAIAILVIAIASFAA